MKQWPVQEAKNQLSLVIKLAQREGPQTITRHGQPVVVIIASQEFRRLRSPKETPLAFFSRFKGIGLKSARTKDLPRKIPV
jgi:prevent-host-death family protein